MTTATDLDPPGALQPLALEPGQIHLRLSEQEVVVRKNGLEFLSTQPVPLWAEVSVDVRSPRFERPLRGNGVVVDCTGNQHTGYTVSVLFLDPSLPSPKHRSGLALAAAI